MAEASENQRAKVKVAPAPSANDTAPGRQGGAVSSTSAAGRSLMKPAVIAAIVVGVVAAVAVELGVAVATVREVMRLRKRAAVLP